MFNVQHILEHGSISDDRLQFIFRTITVTNINGNTSTWTIYVSLWKSNGSTGINIPIENEYLISPYIKAPEYYATHKVCRQLHTGTYAKSEATIFTTGKNLNKANATNSFTQALVDAFGKYNTKRRTSEPTNNRVLPMKLSIMKPGKISSIYKEGVYIQPKYDGIRCLAQLINGKVDLYTRTGKPIANIQHITAAIKTTLLGNSDDLDASSDIVLDGELMFDKHDTPLHIVSGVVRDANSQYHPYLIYNIFDCFSLSQDNVSQKQRVTFLKSLPIPQLGDYADYIDPDKVNPIRFVPTIYTDSEEVGNSYYEKFLKLKYEGLVVRVMNANYVKSCTGRSNNIFKLKPLSTAEFKIEDWTTGVNGKDREALIFIMRTDTNKTFNAVPTWETASRQELARQFMENESLFIYEYKNCDATIQYSTLSTLGIPQQPKFITVRHGE